MARHVITAGHVEINAIDFSEYFNGMELSVEADTQESTGFASGGWREYEGALKNWTANNEYFNDYDAAGFDARIYPLFGTKVPILIRPDNAVRSATNPEWGGMAVINSYMPISGGVGELASGTLGLQGSGALTRTT